MNVLSAPITLGIIVTFSFHSFFFLISLAKSRYLSLFTLFFNYDGRLLGWQSLLFGSFFFFFFFCNYHYLVDIKWSLCISRSQRILDRLKVVHIALIRFIKFQFLAQFPADHPSPPSCVDSYNLFALIYCICLSYDWSFHLYHHISYTCYLLAIYFWLDIVDPNGIVLCCNPKRFSFSLKVSFS